MNKKNKKVLLVEDDRSLSELITMVLELEGYDVAVVYDGEQAINYLDDNGVDLILLDLFMPVQDGTHVLHWLRVEKSMNTRVLIITAMTDQKTRDTVIAAGANGLITKPFDVNGIIQSVDNLLSH